MYRKKKLNTNLVCNLNLKLVVIFTLEVKNKNKYTFCVYFKNPIKDAGGLQQQSTARLRFDFQKSK